MSKINKTALTAALRHFAYAALASLGAAVANGATTPKDLATAVLAGLIGPALGYIDPKNTKYGIGSSK
jgi:hypothetical protein